TECLVDNPALYEANSQRLSGCLTHAQAGHSTEASRLLPERGGTLTINRVIPSSAATASRYSQRASRGQFHTSAVAGSTMGQAWRTNSAKESRASDWSIRLRSSFSLFIGKPFSRGYCL